MFTRTGTVHKTDRPIPTTSYSRIKTFKACQKRAYLAYIKKLPEAERPPLKEGQEYPNDRGSRVHNELEAFVKGEGNFPYEAEAFLDEAVRLRELRQADPSTVITEDMWCFDRDWRKVEKDNFKEIWLRVILDVIVFVSPTEAIVIDYKTGRREGNEVDHARQMQLYQLAAFMLFPKLEVVCTELWYLDQDELASMTFTRNQGKRFFEQFDKDFGHMTSTLVFKSSPNKHVCRFCPYKTGDISKRLGTVGTGDCDENPV